MDRKEEFRNLIERIVDFVSDSGGVMLQAHVWRIFPEAMQKHINYLIKHRRLYEIEDGKMIADAPDAKPKRPAIAATGVLCDFIDKMDDYTFCEYPAQMNLIAKNGDILEILYVKYNDEAGIQASIAMQDKNMAKEMKGYVAPKRIAVLEDPVQAERLNIPSILRFATMEPDGKMTYFSKKKEG